MPDTKISEKYEALEVIGRGSFGIVRKVRRKHTNEVFVRKEIEYQSMNNHERNQLISELRILREFNHPNIVKYYGHDHKIGEKTIDIYMEYCDGGDLAHLISNFKKSQETVPEEFIWQVLVQTLMALHRCHYGIDAGKVSLFAEEQEDSEPLIDSETVVIHRDIKPDNIFLLNNGNSIKIGDFGLAKMLTSQSEFAKTYVGTPYYMSPEVLMDNPYSPKCDIWSLGCVLYELCSLRPPFQAKTHLQLQDRIKDGRLQELPDNYSAQLRSIIKDCITVDPELRPSCFDILQSLSLRFLRKEMELKERDSQVNDWHRKLLAKNEELKRRESILNSMDQRLALEREELSRNFEDMEKKSDLQRVLLEKKLVEEFEERKKAMDQEAKEMRLSYQREFKLVVDNEVQLRIREILLDTRVTNHNVIGSSNKKPDHSHLFSPPHAHQNFVTSPKNNVIGLPNEAFGLPIRPKGPKELPDEVYATDLRLPRRYPLRVKNNDNDETELLSEQLAGNHLSHRFKAAHKKRVTDELERLKLEKRHIPEYEDFLSRKNRF